MAQTPQAAEPPVSARRRVVPLIRVMPARCLAQGLARRPRSAALSALVGLFNPRRLHPHNIVEHCYEKKDESAVYTTLLRAEL